MILHWTVVKCRMGSMRVVTDLFNEFLALIVQRLVLLRCLLQLNLHLMSLSPGLCLGYLFRIIRVCNANLKSAVQVRNGYLHQDDITC